jgi:hypothetical protein
VAHWAAWVVPSPPPQPRCKHSARCSCQWAPRRSRLMVLVVRVTALCPSLDCPSHVTISVRPSHTLRYQLPTHALPMLPVPLTPFRRTGRAGSSGGSPPTRSRPGSASPSHRSRTGPRPASAAAPGARGGREKAARLVCEALALRRTTSSGDDAGGGMKRVGGSGPVEGGVGHGSSTGPSFTPLPGPCEASGQLEGAGHSRPHACLSVVETRQVHLRALARRRSHGCVSE